MNEELPVTAWDPESGSAAGAGVIFGAVFAIAVLLFPDPIHGWWRLVVLLPGLVVIGVITWLLYAPARYTLSETAISRVCRGRQESIALADLTTIQGYYSTHVGNVICLQSPDREFNLPIGPRDVNRLLERIGPLLVASGTDRRTIADEKTRRWLGLPGGGLRDPWTPPERG